VGWEPRRSLSAFWYCRWWLKR